MRAKGPRPEAFRDRRVMGNKASSRNANVLLLGLDGAGKTQLLYRMKLKTEATNWGATTGFNYESVQVPNTRMMLHVWDLAGGALLRRFFRFFYESIRVDILMFVCNLDQRERIDEAAQLYRFLTNEDRLRKAIRVVVLNQDDEKPSAGRLQKDQVMTAFGIDPNSKLTKVIHVNCVTGEGLDDLYLETESCFA